MLSAIVLSAALMKVIAPLTVPEKGFYNTGYRVKSLL
jgi:hypothetical protein